MIKKIICKIIGHKFFYKINLGKASEQRVIAISESEIAIDTKCQRCGKWIRIPKG